MSDKPSKAEVRRRVEAEIARYEHVPVLKDEFEQFVNGFETSHETVSGREDQLRPVCLEMLAYTHVTGIESFKKLVRVVFRYAAWAQRHGHALDADTLLTIGSIEAFCATGLGDVKDATKASMRSLLRNLAAQKPGSGVDRPMTYAHNSVSPPYTPDELAQMSHTVRHQPSESIGQQAMTAFALGIGAGVAPMDLRDLLVGHIRQADDGELVVHVPGRKNLKARTVTVSPQWRDLLTDSLAGLSPDRRVLRRESARSGTAAPVYERMFVGASDLVPDQQRLRTTWIFEHLQKPVTLHELMRAAGLKSARTITDLLRFVPQEEACDVLGVGHE